MSEVTDNQQIRHQEFLEELKQEISNPLHLRLLQAYRDDHPVQAMEEELTTILLEILRREN